MIATIEATAAQSLAKSGLAQLVDGTWLMPGQAPSGPILEGTTAVVDTDAIKIFAPDQRATKAIGVLRDSGIRGDGPVCVYDRAGFFSAPWVAWLLVSHGHSASLVIGDGPPGQSTLQTGDVTSQADPIEMNARKADILAAMGTDTQIVDARPAARFAGTAPEPREGCRAGHMPGALNLPFSEIKDGAGYKDFEDIAAIVRAKGIDLDKPVITTCGSGVTASAIAVPLQRLGAQDVRVYQGSWSEYGMDPNVPVETGA